MSVLKCNITFMDILRLMFFALYFNPIDTSQDYYRTHPSALPEFMKVPTNITVPKGDLAKLKCHIYNLGPKTVFWRRQSMETLLTYGETTFVPDTSISVFHEDLNEMESTWDLMIENVQESHAGTYECQISATNIYTHNVTLNVIDPIESKPNVTLKGTEYVSLMEKIHLTCNATGSVKAFDAVDWFFDGHPIEEMKPKWYNRLTKLNHKPVPGRSLISEIIIEKATMKDRGNYVCRATQKLATGLKVHILNDMKNFIEPKRDSENKLSGNEDGQKYEYSTDNKNCAKQSSQCFIKLTFCLLLYGYIYNRL